MVDRFRYCGGCDQLLGSCTLGGGTRWGSSTCTMGTLVAGVAVSGIHWGVSRGLSMARPRVLAFANASRMGGPNVTVP